MSDTMIAALPEKTGKDLDAWCTILRNTDLEKHGQLVSHLKTEFGVTHGYANLIVHKFRESDADSATSDDDLVDAQYDGGKEHLRPIYDALVKVTDSFGQDVELAPKKTYVSVRRKKQFAILQPSTRSRFDIGLNMKNVEPVGRLEASGSFNAMCTHRVRMESAADVDDEVIGWMREAYEQAG